MPTTLSVEQKNLLIQAIRTEDIQTIRQIHVQNPDLDLEQVHLTDDDPSYAKHYSLKKRKLNVSCHYNRVHKR